MGRRILSERFWDSGAVVGEGMGARSSGEMLEKALRIADVCGMVGERSIAWRTEDGVDTASFFVSCPDARSSVCFALKQQFSASDRLTACPYKPMTKRLFIAAGLSLLIGCHGSAQIRSGVDADLAAHYPLDGNLDDILGHGNRGEFVNGAGFGVGMDGAENGAVKLDGIHAYVLFGKNDKVYPAQEFTWSIWFFQAKAGTAILLWDDDSKSGGDRAVGILPDGSLFGGAWNSGLLTGRVKPGLGRWNHAAFTSGRYGQALYLNGRNVAKSNKVIERHLGSSSLSIGAGNIDHGAPNRVYLDRFNGRLDNVRIYNRPLSEHEVAMLFGEEVRVPVPRTAKATAVVVNGFITSIAIVDGGSGYRQVPKVIIEGAAERTCVAVANLVDGAVASVTVKDPGSGYSDPINISIEPPPEVPRAAVASAVVANGFL